MTYEYDFTESSPGGIAGVQYYLRSRRIEQPFMRRLSSAERDALDIAMAAYTADRRSLRERRKKTSTGQRNITIKVAVREPQIWEQPEVRQELRRLFEWMSGDCWTIELVPCRGLREEDIGQEYLFATQPEAPAAISLFSGGLDSLAGFAGQLEGQTYRSHVLVSANTNSRQRSQQTRQVDAIAETLRSRPADSQPNLEHVAVPMGIYTELGKDAEKSQRMRAFVYLTIGVITARQAGSDTLHIFENGVGALNLRLNETQLGVDNYRGVHPRSLMIVESLFSKVFEQEIRIKNPFLFNTKAEMCVALPRVGLSQVIRDTVSCDKFPLRIEGTSQCGVCTSCILRRHALLSAGLGECDPVTGYRYDILGSREDVPVDDRIGLNVMRGQADRIRSALEAPDQWLELVRRYPNLHIYSEEIARQECMPLDSVRKQILDLYRRYCNEWDNLTHALW